MTTPRDTHSNPMGCVDGNLPNICPTCIHVEVCEHNDGGVKACLTYLPTNAIDALTAERDALKARVEELEAALGDCVKWDETPTVQSCFVLSALHMPVNEEFSRWAGGVWSRAKALLSPKAQPAQTAQLDSAVKGGDSKEPRA